MLDQKQVGEFIAKLRKAKGLTQSALADLFCVTHQAVSKWENGAALPDLEVLMEMRKVFGVSVDDILDCRLPESETPEPPAANVSSDAGANGPVDTITEDTIVIWHSHTFESPVTVDQCSIFGEASFKQDVTSDSVKIMGHGLFEKSITADEIVVAGLADVRGGIQTDAISVMGNLSVIGGISCDSFRNPGITNCGGGIQADSLVNTGSFTIGGGITTDDLQNMGETTVGGGVTCDTFNNPGCITIGGGIISDEFTNRGYITVGGGVTADQATLSGVFRIGGGLAADYVLITLSEEDCSAASIMADSVTVAIRADGISAVLAVREIAADRVDLINVQADLVRADSGRIGPGCCIKRLKCGPGVEISPDAEIVERV